MLHSLHIVKFIILLVLVLPAPEQIWFLSTFNNSLIMDSFATLYLFMLWKPIPLETLSLKFSPLLCVRNIDQNEGRTPISFIVQLCFFSLKAGNIDVS